MKIPTLKLSVIDHNKCAEIVRKTREKSGLSLRQLAILLDVSAPFLSDLERGNRNWSEERFNAAMHFIKLNKK